MADFKVTPEARKAFNEFLGDDVFPKELEGKSCKVNGEEIDCVYQVNRNDRDILSFNPKEGYSIYRNECLKGKACEGVDGGYNETDPTKLQIISAVMFTKTLPADFLTSHKDAIAALKSAAGIKE